MQQNFCQAADTGIGNSVIIGHFNLVLGGSSDVQPRRGGGMCLAGPIQQISSLAADTGINYSVIGPFSIWSFKLRFLCCLTQGEGGGGFWPMQRNYCTTTSNLLLLNYGLLRFKRIPGRRVGPGPELQKGGVFRIMYFKRRYH